MAVTDLIATLERQAEKEAAIALERGQQEAAELTRAARSQVELELSTDVAAYEARAHAENERALSEARRRLAHALLSSKERAVARVLERARERAIEALQSDRYRALVPQLRERARSKLGEAEVTISEDHGLMIASSDGSISVDARILTRLEKLAPDLAIDIVAQIVRPE